MNHVEIICCSNKKRSLYFDLTLKHLFYSLFLFTGLMLISFYVGSYTGIERYSKQFLIDYTNTLEQQQQEIVQTKQEAQSKLNLMSVRLANLQTHMMRLNALANTLASQTNVEDISFLDHQLESEFNLRIASPKEAKVNDFIYELEQLSHELEDRTDKLSALENILVKSTITENLFPSIMPIKAYVSSWFGPRFDPISSKKLFHEGIDFSADVGSNVVSTAAGIVTWAGPLDNYGNVVEINHGNGFVTRYAHNHEHYVKVGEKVRKGQLIASVGNSGRSTGPHLHYEVIKDGKHLNPKRFMKLN